MKTFNDILPGIEVHAFDSRADWLEARRRYVTASEAASVLGEGYESPFALWHIKRGVDLPPMDEERLEAGIRMEPVIAQWYQDVTGREVQDLGPWTLCVNPRFPFLAASLDRIVKIDDVWCPLELKNPNAFKLSEWDNDIPLRFHIQNQVQMLCTGTRRGAVASIVGGSNFRHMDTFEHPALQSLIIKECKRFLECVESGEMPEVDGSEQTRNVLHHLHPRDTGERVALPREAYDWVVELEAVKAEIKELEKKKGEIENRVKSLMGDASVGYFPGGEWSWKHQGGRTSHLTLELPYAQALDKMDVPYRVATTAESRVLRPKLFKKESTS